MLSVVSLSFVVGSLAVVVKGTAAEILHHLLLTIRRGKSPIRLRKVKLVALGSFEADGQFFGDARTLGSPPLPERRGCCLRAAFGFLSVPLACARWITVPFLPSFQLS